MPIFNYKCTDCKADVKRILNYPPPQTLECPKCGAKMVRNPGKGPTSTVKEVLDDGWSPKAVERFKDSVEVFEDNAKVERE